MLECPPCVTLHQAMQFQPQCCYGIQLFVCFLHVYEIGTYVCDPKIHRTPREVDFESVKFPAVCSLLLDSQRDNTVCSWMCDQRK